MQSFASFVLLQYTTKQMYIKELIIFCCKRIFVNYIAQLSKTSRKLDKVLAFLELEIPEYLRYNNWAPN